MLGNRDHRKLPRRRGAVLNSAIFEVVRGEIAESGYAALTMDSVAERARASKASLYRRWPGRAACAKTPWRSCGSWPNNSKGQWGKPSSLERRSMKIIWSTWWTR
jgi:hypothetical protein